ncbi:MULTISPECIES: ParB N-terminal domain-containing protein [unclassified Streptomyces]|uniref:ParB/RepB/Spo0J family partition protein n=1 Tax=Streptomyces sp. NBC_00060 TaxID=2975636 RepID=A0AAU2GVM2_9ACTN
MSLAEQSIDDQLLKIHAADLDEVVTSMVWIESHPAGEVRIDSLVFEDSPRLGGADEDHVRVLAEAGDSLPPITVHRSSMRVIDGTHRVRAALLNGRTTIQARMVDCDEGAAYVLAVKANVTHGLPLSRSDRSVAAARIIMTHPQWSDRAVAAAVGLSDKTISRIRSRSSADAPQSNARLGRDGRLRPLDSGYRRQQAAAMIHERPNAGLREVARATGLSPATVRDVRQRIDRGEDPVPGRYRAAAGQSPAPGAPVVPRQTQRAVSARSERRDISVDRQKLLAKLSEDPSLRLNEAGRRTLRWLHHYTVDGEGMENLGRGLPGHWAPEVADLARSCAAAWQTLAEQLQQRAE